MNKGQLFATKQKIALTIVNVGIFLLGATIVSCLPSFVLFIISRMLPKK